jgi:hypothetical protein
MKEGIMPMLQQSTRSSVPQPLVQPRRRDVFFHGVKTFRLLGALIREPRIPVMRKVLFLGSIAALLVVLIFPDILDTTILGTLLPLVGVVLGVPIDAGMDWIAFSMVIVSLLRFFPAELVSEHYRNIFER